MSVEREARIAQDITTIRPPTATWPVEDRFGEREVQRALRRTLLKYRLHKEQDVFDKAYGYVKQYY